MKQMLSDAIYKISRVLNRKPTSVYRSAIDKSARIGNGAQIFECCIGRYTYIYESKVIFTDIGSFCSIAADCTIGGGSHPVAWVATSPVFTGNKNVFKKNFSNNVFNEFTRTKIGNDVWIGSKCLIKGGVTIGDGAIIGMGSVVTHDVPPYEIWAGNPAKQIRRRFDEETINKLLELQWWNWDDDRLSEIGFCFSSVYEFLKRI